MIAALVSLALMIAAWLFVMSLFFGDTDAAKTLRRGAAFSFAFVFLVPTLFYALGGVRRGITHDTHTTMSAIEFGLVAVGLIALVVVFSFAAYGYINFRSETRSRHAPGQAPGVRFAKQRPDPRADPHDEEEDG